MKINEVSNIDLLILKCDRSGLSRVLNPWTFVPLNDRERIW